MAKNRANRKNRRHTAKLSATTKRPQGKEFLSRTIPHKEYGEVLVVVDSEIGKYIQLATNGLKVSREMPIFSNAAELPVTDPYVAFYRSYMDDDGDSVYPLDVAQRKAMIAYDEPAKTIAGDALILALVHYTDFEGDVPFADDLKEDSEERLAYGLPPELKRDKHSPLELKIDHVRFMSETDIKFNQEMTAAVNEAVAKVQAEGLMEEEEEVSEEGFQPESAD